MLYSRAEAVADTAPGDSTLRCGQILTSHSSEWLLSLSQDACPLESVAFDDLLALFSNGRLLVYQLYTGGICVPASGLKAGRKRVCITHRLQPRTQPLRHRATGECAERSVIEVRRWPRTHAGGRTVMEEPRQNEHTKRRLCVMIMSSSNTLIYLNINCRTCPTPSG